MFLKKSVRANKNLLWFNLEYAQRPVFLLEFFAQAWQNINLLFRGLIFRRNAEYVLFEKLYTHSFIKNTWENNLKKNEAYLQKRNMLAYYTAVLTPVVFSVLCWFAVSMLNAVVKVETLVTLTYLLFLAVVVFTITGIIVNFMDNKITSFCLINTVYDYDKYVHELIMFYCREKELFTMKAKDQYPLSYNDISLLYDELKKTDN